MELIRVYVILWHYDDATAAWIPVETPFSYQFDPVTGENDLNNLLYMLAFLNMTQYLAMRTYDTLLPIGSYVCTPGGNTFEVPGTRIASARIQITDGVDKVDKWYGDPDFAIYGAFNFGSAGTYNETKFVNLPDQQFVPIDVTASDGFHMSCKPGVSAIVTTFQNTYYEGSIYLEWSLVLGGPYTTLVFPTAGQNMGDQWLMAKAVYVADNLAEYVVGIRQDQAITGGFAIVDPATPVSLPRGLKMRYVLGYDEYTNARHKQYVANPGFPFMTAGEVFYYLTGTFFIGAVVGEKFPNKF